MALFNELYRRRVFRVAAIYLAVAWGATEMLTFIFDRIPIFPYWLGTVVTILFVLGFPVTMFLAWMFDIGRDGISRTRPATAKGGLTIAGALVLLAAATYGFAFLILSDSDVDVQLTGSQVEDPPINSIAVLPFVNLSGDPKDEILSDGLAEELTHQLAAAESLFVVGRTSAFYFKNKSAEFSEIRERLRVAHVLEGSVRRLENEIRVTSQLIDTGTGYEVWSTSFDGEIRNVFDIQHDIAKAVAATLGAVIRDSDEIVYKPSEKANFYVRYFEGLRELRAEEDEAATMALEIFSALLGDDPDFHGAQFGLAMSYYQMAAAGLLSWSDASYFAFMELDRIDQGFLTGRDLTLRGMFYLALGNPDAARGLFADALKLEPRNSDALIGLADAESKVDLGRSQQLYEQALAADPLNPKVIQAMGETDLEARDTEKADETEKVVPDIYPIVVVPAPAPPTDPGEETFGQQDVQIPLSTSTSSELPGKVCMTHTEVVKSGLVELKTLFDQQQAEPQFEIDCDQVREILGERSDIRYTTQLILGRHYRVSTADDRNLAIRSFETKFSNNLCESLYDITSMSYEFLPYRGDATKKRTTVKTTVLLGDGTKVPVSYGLVNRGPGCWLIFDLTIDGISIVRNLKAELNSMLGQSKALDEAIEEVSLWSVPSE